MIPEVTNILLLVDRVTCMNSLYIDVIADNNTIDDKIRFYSIKWGRPNLSKN